MKAVAPIDVLTLFPPERASLLDLLSGLSADDWAAPTACPGWSVKDIALHLLADDLGRLSRGRDGFAGAAFVPERRGGYEAELLAFINRMNEMWVAAARRLSPRLLVDLLRFSGGETQRYFESLDPDATGEPVSWAGPDPAPVWLDLAREYTERWLHHQQVRDALGRPGLKEPRFFAPVLDTFVRALPHTFRDVLAPEGTQVSLSVTGGSGGHWTLLREAHRWTLHRGAARGPAAAVALNQETAWRLFTKGIAREEALANAELSGDVSLAAHVLDTVSIIA
jgi:uncharacterized protein (TIGR03083 family)